MQERDEAARHLHLKIWEWMKPYYDKWLEGEMEKMSKAYKGEAMDLSEREYEEIGLLRFYYDPNVTQCIKCGAMFEGADALAKGDDRLSDALTKHVRSHLCS